MSVTINGTTGIAGVDGSASTPAVQGTDTNTGIFFGTDTVTVATGGTTAVTVDSGQRTKFPTTIGVGNATPSTSGSGITFPATASASSDANTLDDYEEGTWTPSVGGTATYTTQTGKYTKIGNVVNVEFILKINAIGTGTTNRFSGLPFTTPSARSGSCAIYFDGPIAVNVTYLVGLTGSNNTELQFYATSSNTNAVSATNILGNGARVAGSFIYTLD